MIPKIYSGKDEAGNMRTTFNGIGFGTLTDSLECTITEEINGEYELKLTYPVDGIRFEYLQLDNVIYVKNGDLGKEQAFDIYDISKPINGKCTIKARHVSYRLSNATMKPVSAGSATQAMSIISENIIAGYAIQQAFSFSSTVTNSAKIRIKKPNSIRYFFSEILNTSGAGGEFEYDNFNIKHMPFRGVDRNVSIAYSKNLTDINVKESFDDVVGAILPYFYKEENQDGKESVTLVVGGVCKGVHADDWNYPRCASVDVTQMWENQESLPTQQDVTNLGAKYIKDNGITGNPLSSIEVSFVSLRNSPEYKNISVLETVLIGDTVRVRHPKLGVDIKTRVVKTEWDCLKERYNSVILGTASKGLAGILENQQKEILNETVKKSDLQIAVDKLTKMIMDGGESYLKFEKNPDGSFKEMLVMDSADPNTAASVWRFNSNGIAHSSTGPAGPYTVGMASDGSITGEQITSGLIDGALINVETLKLYGEMSVYKDDTLAGVGGYLGYAEGSTTFEGDPDARTKGMHLIDATQQSEVICTEKGVRMTRQGVGSIYIAGEPNNEKSSIWLKAFAILKMQADRSLSIESHGGSVWITAKTKDGVTGAVNINSHGKINLSGNAGVAVEGGTGGVAINATYGGISQVCRDGWNAKGKTAIIDGTDDARITSSVKASIYSPGESKLVAGGWATVAGKNINITSAENIYFNWGNGGQNYTISAIFNSITYIQEKVVDIDIRVSRLELHSSDLRKKEEINYSLKSDLKKFEQLKPVSYKFKDKTKHDFGFIAQDVMELFPECVVIDKEGFLHLDYNSLFALGMAKILEQCKELKEEKKKNADLEKRMQLLEEKIGI